MSQHRDSKRKSKAETMRRKHVRSVKYRATDELGGMFAGAGMRVAR